MRITVFSNTSCPCETPAERYGSVAQTLHWAIVVLLIVQFTLGKIADGLPIGLDKLVTLARHKSFGITILALAAIRLLWRLFNRPPPLPPMPGWQRAIAHLNHAALYALLFAMPLTGWLMSSANNYPVSWFGLVQLPDLVAPDAACRTTSKTSTNCCRTSCSALAACTCSRRSSTSSSIATTC